MSFRLKIALSMICLMAVLFGVGGSLLVSYVFDETFEGERNSALDSYRWVMGTVTIANALDPASGIEGVEDALRQLSSQQNGSWSALALFDKGDVIFSIGNPLGVFEGELSPGTCSISYDVADDGAQMIVASGLIDASGEELTLRIARDVSFVFQERDALTRAFQTVFLIAIALCALVSFILASLLTRPLRRLSQATRAIAKGDLSKRVDVASSDEVGMLASDLNTMAASLERGVNAMTETMESQERFIGSFAHEVKTPITSIIGYAELASADMLDKEELEEAHGFIASEGRRLERLSRKLLQLQLIQREGIDLRVCSPRQIAEAAVASSRRLLAREGIEIELKAESGDRALEPDLVMTLLTNLIENARRAFDGSQTAQPHIIVSVGMVNEGCDISVEDNGRGIPESSLSRLTDAFYRVDKSRSRKAGGAGLGLSLCQEIANAHGGSLDVTSKLGEGTRITAHLRAGGAS